MSKKKLAKLNVEPDVKICPDRGALRLQFSTRISQHYYGRRQHYKSVGLSNTPQNLIKLAEICRLIQLDLDHPDTQFDLTLQKYLEPERFSLLNAIASPSLTLKILWDDFANWKLSTGQIHQTTYLTRYTRTYRNWLTPWLDEPVNFEMIKDLTISLINGENYKPTLKKLFRALNAMGDRAVRLGKLEKNYFAELAEVNVRVPKKSISLKEQEDYRAYSLPERDIIIKSFYDSQNVEERATAQLIEFLFLTGCRLGEAFALKWDDFNPNWIIFDESYSTETKITKATKTEVTRLFKTTGYKKLLALLDDLKANNLRSDKTGFVFANWEGKGFNRLMVDKVWRGKNSSTKFKPGVVSRLVDDLLISSYLKPSSTRHTMITLQARSGVDLKLLADSVGNSVDTIYKHYLGADKSAVLNNI